MLNCEMILITGTRKDIVYCCYAVTSAALPGGPGGSGFNICEQNLND